MRAIAGWFRKKDRDKRLHGGSAHDTSRGASGGGGGRYASTSNNNHHHNSSGVGGNEPLRIDGEDEELPVTPRTERELFLCVTCAACYCKDHAWDHNYSRGDRGGASTVGGSSSNNNNNNNSGSSNSSTTGGCGGGSNNGNGHTYHSSGSGEAARRRYPCHSLFIGVSSYVSTHPAHVLPQTDWGLLLPTVLVREVEDGLLDRSAPQPFYDDFATLADACTPCVSAAAANASSAHSHPVLQLQHQHHQRTQSTSKDDGGNYNNNNSNSASHATTTTATTNNNSCQTHELHAVSTPYDGHGSRGCHRTVDTTTLAKNNNNSNSNVTAGDTAQPSQQPQQRMYSQADAAVCNASLPSTPPAHAASRLAQMPPAPPSLLLPAPAHSMAGTTATVCHGRSHLVTVEQPPSSQQQQQQPKAQPRVLGPATTTAASAASSPPSCAAPPPLLPRAASSTAALTGAATTSNTTTAAATTTTAVRAGGVVTMSAPVYYATPSDNWSYMMWCARCSVRPVRMTGAHYDADSASQRALRRVGQLLALLAYLRYRGVRLEMPLAYLTYTRAHQQAAAASALSSQLLLLQQQQYGGAGARAGRPVSVAEMQNVMKSTEMLNGALMPQLAASSSTSSSAAATHHYGYGTTHMHASQHHHHHPQQQSTTTSTSLALRDASSSSFVSSTTAAAIAAINAATALPASDARNGGGRVLLPRVEVDKLLTRMGMCGFSNTNYFCYINSVLQCVLRCLYFCQPLLRLDLAASPGKLTTSLCHLLCQLRDQTYQDVLNHAADPFVLAVYKQICGDGGLFEVDQQQDAHELLITLLNGVADEFDKGKSEAEKKASRRISFEGVLRTKVMCCVCHNEVRRNEMFMSLSVPVEPSLQDSLSKLFKDSYLVGRNRYACESCFSKLSKEQQDAHNAAARQQDELRKRQKAAEKSKDAATTATNTAVTTSNAAAADGHTTTTTTTPLAAPPPLPLHPNCVYQDAVVHMEIAQLGETLAVHLLRFQYSAATQSFDKITTPVRVPFELDLTPYVSRKTLKQYSEMLDYHTLLRRFRHVDEATCSRYFVEAGHKYRAACARMVQEGYDTNAAAAAATTPTTTTVTTTTTPTSAAAVSQPQQQQQQADGHAGDAPPPLSRMTHSKSAGALLSTAGPLMLSPYGRVLVHRGNSAIATTTTADDAAAAAGCGAATAVTSDEYNIRLLHPPSLVRRLVGIVIHRGSLDSGHYIAFVRYLDMPDTWYRCDDEDIDVVDQQMVEEAAAETYLAFYE